MQNKNPLLIVTSLAVALAIALAVGQSVPTGAMDEAVKREPLSVSIATLNASDQKHRGLTVQDERHFHVVITNNSDEDQRLWESWNSWGFFNLRFEILDEKGEVVDSIVKTPLTFFTRNFASHTVIKTGQHFVINVDLSDKAWVIDREKRPYAPFVETDHAKNRNKLTLRAVFDIPKDKETDEQSVWVGKIQTKPETFQIWTNGK